MDLARASIAAWVACLCLAGCATTPTPEVETEPDVQAEEPAAEEPAAEEPEVESQDSSGAADSPSEEPEDEGTELDAATKQALAETIRGYLPELQTCYESELAKDSTLAGKMTCTITVERTGSVRKVAIDEDTVGSAAVRACAIAKIEAWRFEAEQLEEPADVTFAVKFEAV